MTTKQLDNGYALDITEEADTWVCRVIAPDGRVVDTLSPVLGRGSEQEAWAAGTWRAAEHQAEPALIDLFGASWAEPLQEATR